MTKSIKNMGTFLTGTQMPTIQKTNDYSLFKSIDGNRSKNRLHIDKLKKSMESNYLFTAIVVNKHYQIIDGQHRFEAIKELGLDLYYIVMPDYGIYEVQVLNQNSKDWNFGDFLDGFCNMGLPDYLHFRAFKNHFGFSYNLCLALLMDTNSEQPCIDHRKVFESGTFKIKNIERAYDRAEKMTEVGKYYDKHKNRRFTSAYLKLLNNPNFDHSEFISKLQLQPTKLKDCANATQYIELIEEIYNYKRREKVNLRFS